MPRRARKTGCKVPFRLTKKARTLEPDWADSLTEESAYEFVKELRFRDNGGAPFCPKCQSTKYYDIKARPGWWSCANSKCRKQFSVTSGTILHSRKLKYRALVKTVFEFADCSHGRSACELALKRKVDYKTMFVLLMKFRQGMSSKRDTTWLQNIIEMDAAYFGGMIRKTNKVGETKGPKLSEFQRGKRVIMVARQRDGKSVMFATNSENSAIAAAMARTLVKIDENTVLVTDDAAAYRDLEAIARHDTVDHKVGFKLKGVSTNMAESSFSRARRSVLGVYHHWSPTWLDFYAGEMGWREDMRRAGNRQQAEAILSLALKHPQSRDLKGYWQHWMLPDNQLKRPEIRFERVHSAVKQR
jgi:transposase-like protein